MALFRNAHHSHEHSLEVLNLIYGYDSFLDNLGIIADMGCGAGLDAAWWASLYTRDDPPEPRNYKVYAVDQNICQLDPDVLKAHPNIIPIEADFTRRCIPLNADLIWSHDSFHLVADPLSCLDTWRGMLNPDGMLVLSIPQTTYVVDNRLVIANHNHQFHNYNVLNLIYMLALSGFDCRDAYFYRKVNSPWLYAACYATSQQPLPPTTTWHELVELGLVHERIALSVEKYGHARIEDLIVTWLDKDFYQISS